MEQFSGDPGARGANPVGTPPSSPAWAGQPATPPPAPAWAGQPTTPTQAPAWVGQSASLPLNVTSTRLKRDSQWPALRLIARILKIVAWIELVFGVIGAVVVGTSIGSLGSSLGVGGFLFAILILIGTAIGFMLTYAYAEFIQVFLAIEMNTRKHE